MFVLGLVQAATNAGIVAWLLPQGGKVTGYIKYVLAFWATLSMLGDPCFAHNFEPLASLASNPNLDIGGFNI